ncbi:type II toxin-antitoxin system MqsA family antitoxin [Chitinophaga rhizosphaerae]|uniref:type II toxin-antitoxin system MqsA family antitoxin n=1 Tax=Chitinophaga rhizosphaerae TaxID=1864947 RepID=UPI0013E004A7|nr:type II toxin-antitoxin system MqsA family antitoxin [Chitinophaga rhizosphaerae]
MECTQCKKGKREPGQVTVFLERDDAAFVVRGVPADICNACGFYDVSPEIMDILEKKATNILQQEARMKLMHLRPGSA